MAKDHPFRGGVSGAKHRCLFDLFQLSPGGMDFTQDDQHNRAAQQGVPTSDQGYGDCSRGDRLLSDPGLHLFENGDALEVKPCRKSA